MKIYVIETGEYSDRGIYAVLTDKEKAEQLLDFAKGTTWDHAADMITYETDDYDKGVVPEIKSIMYTVWFDKLGHVDQIDKTYNHTGKAGSTWKNVWTGDISVDVYADDEESAVKIAAEKRAKFLAEEYGL